MKFNPFQTITIGIHNIDINHTVKFIKGYPGTFKASQYLKYSFNETIFKKIKNLCKNGSLGLV